MCPSKLLPAPRSPSPERAAGSLLLGEGLRSPSGGLWWGGGRPARVKGWGWGSRRRGVVGRAAAGRGESALNRGPQLGFIMISVGDSQSPLLSRWGN